MIEQSIIGSLLIDPTLISVFTLDIEDFKGTESKNILNIILENEKNNIITTIPILMDRGVSIELIDEFLERAPTTAFFQDECKQLREARIKRELSSAGKIIQSNCDLRETQVLLDDIYKKSLLFSSPKTVDELMNIHFEKYSSEFVCIKSPLPTLNNIAPLAMGEMKVLAALPGMGKTTLAINIAIEAAKNGSKVLFVSLEMSESVMLDRVYSYLSGIPEYKFKKNLVKMEEYEVARQEFEKLKNSFKLLHEPGITGSALNSMVLREKAVHGVDLVIVDYLQLMGREDNEERDDIRIGKITSGLQTLALKSNCSVLLLAQFNRNAGGNKPHLHELKGSSSIEQDATAVFILHREKVDGLPGKNGTISIAKNRFGEQGEIDIVFNYERMEFKELTNMQKYEAYN